MRRAVDVDGTTCRKLMKDTEQGADAHAMEDPMFDSNSTSPLVVGESLKGSKR